LRAAIEAGRFARSDRRTEERDRGMDDRLPDFLVIGAMKCATTTLHEQLARQPGIAMSWPKEPNFFSDDDVYALGLDWYASIFRGLPEGRLLGESSTHYTKRPNHPRTVERMARALPGVKLVYLMRHPVDRLVSHYRHERLDRRIVAPIDEAIDLHPELVDYGRYAMQLEPYLDRFGPDRVHPIFFERLVAEPQVELERLCEFLGLRGRPHWDRSMKPRNTTDDRMRRSELRDVVVNAPVLAPLRRRLVPRGLSERVKDLWRVKPERPTLSAESEERLRELFDPDLAQLGAWMGVSLDCSNFTEVARAGPTSWLDVEEGGWGRRRPRPTPGHLKPRRTSRLRPD
jgi:hypothetical protein